MPERHPGTVAPRAMRRVGERLGRGLTAGLMLECESSAELDIHLAARCDAWPGPGHGGCHGVTLIWRPPRTYLAQDR